jgi:hypothetical protein
LQVLAFDAECATIWHGKVEGQMSFRAVLVSLFLLLTTASSPARPLNEAAIIDGFNRTVFGSEFWDWGQAALVKKYVVPVRLYVDDRSGSRRRGTVERFVRSLPRLIKGLQVEIVTHPSDANFRVFVVDRHQYYSVVAEEVFGRASSTFAPGKCLVRVLSGRAGISRSDAVIVADEGEFLFRRCMVEEILQGLGPVNDDAALPESVFNDTSRHSAFTRFDRAVLNMLYDPAIRPGMTQKEAQRLLPAIAADVSKRLR